MVPCQTLESPIRSLRDAGRRPRLLHHLVGVEKTVAIPQYRLGTRIVRDAPPMTRQNVLEQTLELNVERRTVQRHMVLKVAILPLHVVKGIMGTHNFRLIKAKDRREWLPLLRRHLAIQWRGAIPSENTVKFDQAKVDQERVCPV